MLPFLIGAAAAAGSVFNIITGISQNNKAKKSLNEYNQYQAERPQFQTPQEAMRILSMAYQDVADPTMPGESAARDRTSQNFSNVVGASSQAGNPFAALVGAQAQADAGNQNITTASATYQDQQQQQLNEALQMVGSYKDQEFQMNQWAPWADKTQMALNQYRDYRQAGNNNVASGLNGLSTIAMGMLSPGMASSGQGPDMNGLQSIYSKYSGVGQQPQSNSGGNAYPPVTFPH